MQTLIPVNYQDVSELASLAGKEISRKRKVQNWSDFRPVLETFLTVRGRSAIPECSRFLIDQGVISEAQYDAACRGFRRLKKKINQPIQ